MDLNLNRSGGQPILLKLLLPVTLLIVMVVMLVFGAIFGTGMMGQLDRNASDILYEKVLNRKNYLENEMITRWSYITLTAEQINLSTQAFFDARGDDVSILNSEPKVCAELLSELTPELISMLRSNGVNGAFVVFNTEDLTLTAPQGRTKNKLGIYMRDLDATSLPSFRNADLLLLCSPSDTVRSLGISTDSAWNPFFDFSETGYLPFLYEPYMAAYQDAQRGEFLSLADYGYWSTPYRLPGDRRDAISYSVPLILPDGRVYGVLGVEILQDSLRKVLPYAELGIDQMGTYLFATDDSGDLTFSPVVVNGSLESSGEDLSGFVLSPSGDPNAPAYTLHAVTDSFYCSVAYLKLYNANTAFSSRRWAVIGVARAQELFSVSRRSSTLLVSALMLSLAVGLFGSLFVSYLVARPVSALSREMTNVNPGLAIRLKRTNIVEIDHLIASVEALSDDVIDSGNKLSKILDMASIKIAGFELCDADSSVFVTDNFFDLFGRTPALPLTPASLRAFIDEFSPFLVDREDGNGRTVYRLPRGTSYIYLRLNLAQDDRRTFGLVEDATKELLEVEKIEHERDHDVLTSLMNRRAFGRTMHRLFDSGPALLKTAALVMLDLDNLKHFNDTYGHETGDRYIKTAADCFVAHTPPGTVLSRMAGDEFCLFFYGYESKEQLRGALSRLRKGIDSCSLPLAGAAAQPLQVSAGIAWYPGDADGHEQLLKYADFAMYTVKRSVKNGFADFDPEVYRRDLFEQQRKSDLHRMLEYNLFSYRFQPIVRTADGSLLGYEALLKPNVPSLSAPGEVLAVARREGKLAEMEALTWFNALASFAAHIKAREVPAGCKLFINSIASQLLLPEAVASLEDRFPSLLHRVVLEITEDEDLSELLLEVKVRKVREWGGELALDDYGSGYNSEMALLRLSPKYIKIDNAIIRSVDDDIDKQKLVSNTVSYAHERGMIVIAEGVETEAEFAAVRAMGIDCAQGFLFTRTLPDLRDSDS